MDTDESITATSTRVVRQGPFDRENDNLKPYAIRLTATTVHVDLVRPCIAVDRQRAVIQGVGHRLRLRMNSEYLSTRLHLPRRPVLPDCFPIRIPGFLISECDDFMQMRERRSS